MNVVSSLWLAGFNGVTVGGTGASVKFFPPLAGTSDSKRGYVYCPGHNRANGQHLYARAAGNFKSASDVSIGLYAVVGSGLPLLIGRRIMTGAPVIGPWMFTAQLAGDSGSGVVQTLFNNEPATHMQGVDFLSDEPFALGVGVIFSASSEKNAARMYQFDLLQ